MACCRSRGNCAITHLRGNVMFAGAQALFVSAGLCRCSIARTLPPEFQPTERTDRMIRASAFALALLAATPALAEPETYTLDPSHSQIVFSYNHLGFSTSYGMFSGFNGEIVFDQADPAKSSVTVSFPVRTMLTGW